GKLVAADEEELADVVAPLAAELAGPEGQLQLHPLPALAARFEEEAGPGPGRKPLVHLDRRLGRGFRLHQSWSSARSIGVVRCPGAPGRGSVPGSLTSRAASRQSGSLELTREGLSP